MNILAAAVLLATGLLALGWHKPLLPGWAIIAALIFVTIVFVGEKPLRLLNTDSKKLFIRLNWFELPLAAVFLILAAGFLTHEQVPAAAGLVIWSIYLLIEFIIKLCRTMMYLTSSAKNPSWIMLASFIVLILCGAGLLALPRSYRCSGVSLIDIVFTAASATCVTGLTVMDIGRDFSVIGQTVILVLIQMGGLGVIIFGAFFAILTGQSLSVRESTAMRDVLNEETSGRIEIFTTFIFTATLIIETIGAICLYNMWDNSSSFSGGVSQKWFYSFFHSISAFCNAGFGLPGDSLVGYNRSMGIYLVIMPLIVLGGLGFGVLYDVFFAGLDRIRRNILLIIKPYKAFEMNMPRRCSLHSKLVMTVTFILIFAGMAGLMVYGLDAGGAIFQSVTARTAGFNSVAIESVSPGAKIILILLMFIGGSPGSTAGGIKTITFAVLITAVLATIRKRREVEMFGRALPLVTVGRALTVFVLYMIVLLTVVMLLHITEKDKPFTSMDIFFEAVSALGTVGLSTGITPALSDAGKIILVFTMFFGRLGALTLLTAVTFNIRPAKYNYPVESVIIS